ncbi:MAG: tryptophan 7-halogenase [Planctomycetota bacterium]|nr:tryptophan 7-halogenase [Planctomycetota bacterium]
MRSEFDQMLLDDAVAKGAELMEETVARELLRDGDAVVGIAAERADGSRVELHAPVTIDASGRDAFAQSRNRWRVPDEKLKKISIWTYCVDAVRDPGIDEGATTIAYLPDKGWFWYIALPCDSVSVGIVADRDYLYRDTRDPGEIFAREVAIQPWIERHLAPGRLTGRYYVTSDFSYRSRHCSENGLVLTGDAYAFLDPVFSSGVFLALQGGVLAGDAVDAALTAGDASAERFEEYGRRCMRGLEAMRRLVHAFYDTTFNFADFLREHPGYRADLTDVLIGNLERDFEPFFAAVSEFADIPAPLEHGLPRVRGGA